MSKKTPCPIEAAGLTAIDYKDVTFLKQFLSKFNRIVPRQYSGTTLKNQKMLATAVKRARYMALLPYVVDPRHKTFVSEEAAVATTEAPSAPEVDPALDEEGTTI